MPLRPQIRITENGIELICMEGMRRLSIYNSSGKTVFNYQGNTVFSKNIALQKNSIYLIIIDNQKAFKYFLNRN